MRIPSEKKQAGHPVPGLAQAFSCMDEQQTAMRFHAQQKKGNSVPLFLMQQAELPVFPVRPRTIFLPNRKKGGNDYG